MKKFFSVMTVLVLVGSAFVLIATAFVVAELYDAGSFVETCGDFVDQPVSEVTREIAQSELTWKYAKTDGVIRVYQDNILLSDRFCSLNHSNGVIVNATWK
jgi:hypothetical protein